MMMMLVNGGQSLGAAPSGTQQNFLVHQRDTFWQVAGLMQFCSKGYKCARNTLVVILVCRHMSTLPLTLISFRAQMHMKALTKACKQIVKDNMRSVKHAKTCPTFSATPWSR